MTTTDADVQQRLLDREHAERAGLDPDTHVGPILFTDAEWAAMTSTRQNRIDFGLELQCGCRPGSCSSEYGGDCWRYDPDTGAWDETSTSPRDPARFAHINPAWDPTPAEDEPPF